MPDLGFFETMRSAGALPISEIKRIGEPQTNAHGVELRAIHMKDGGTFETFEAEKGGLLRRPVQLIPAEPGTSIIRVDAGERSASVDRTRLIAWALCLDGEVRPVVPGGVCDGLDDPTYVELPDGTIEAVGEWADPSGFESASAMVRHFAPEVVDAIYRAFDEAEANVLAARAAYEAHPVAFADEDTDLENKRLGAAVDEADASYLALEPRTAEQAIRQLCVGYLDGAPEIEVPSAKIVHLAKLLGVSL